MTSPRKAQWKTLQRLAENLVFTEAPKIFRQLQESAGARPGIHHGMQGLQRGLKAGLQVGLKVGTEVLAAGGGTPRTAIAAGRPVTTTSFPTAQRARKLIYAPDLAGRAEPGEIVWAWVADGDDPAHGEDQPVLVVGRDRRMLLGLMLSSHTPDTGDRDWVGIGRGGWDDTADTSGRPSWVRLDRVLDVPEEGIRREGAVLGRETFEVVAAALRTHYRWS